MHPKELEEMKNREKEQQRKKRIEAGVEEDDGNLSMDMTGVTGDTMSEENFVLTTENGQEITLVSIKGKGHSETESGAISVPVSILDEHGSVISTETIVTRFQSSEYDSSKCPSENRSVILKLTDLKDGTQVYTEHIG